MSQTSSMGPRELRRLVRVTVAVLIGLLFLIPILYVVMIGIESPQQFLTHPLVPPVPPTAQNFSSAYQQGDLGPEVVNTAIYSVSAAAISTGLSLLIAFPIARRLIRWSSPLYSWFVIGICLPLPIIPLFIEARQLHLYDNRIGYILLHVEPGLPLGVILLTAFISGIPKELDEAAWIDGSGYFKVPWCRRGPVGLALHCHHLPVLVIGRLERHYRPCRVPGQLQPVPCVPGRI